MFMAYGIWQSDVLDEPLSRTCLIPQLIPRPLPLMSTLNSCLGPSMIYFAEDIFVTTARPLAYVSDTGLCAIVYGST